MVAKPIQRHNLGDNYFRKIRQHSLLLNTFFSLGISIASGLIIWYFNQNLVLQIFSPVLGLIAFLVLELSGIVYRQHLLSILDTLLPFAQAERGDKPLALTEVEQLFKQYLINLKTAPTPKPSTSADLTSLNNSNFGFALINNQCQIIYANQFYQRLTTMQNALQLDFKDGILNLQQWISDNQKQKLIANHTWQSQRFWRDEQEQWFDIFANFQKDNPIETVIIITESTEQNLERQKASDFIAYAAHELRGPITIIKGYLDILKNDFPELSSEIMTIVDRLIVAGNRMSSYINNILNSTSYDQHNFKLELAPLNIETVLEDIYDDVILRASTNQRQLNFEVAKNLPALNLNRTGISQALTNLIDNAVKYSKPQQTITVKIFQQNQQLIIQVIDQGIGMPPNVLNSLFKRFYRSHRSENNTAGTGIGLFITKTIIEAHHGSITVSSQPNKGSTFTISLPIETDLGTQPNSNFISNHGMLRK